MTAQLFSLPLLHVEAGAGLVGKLIVTVEFRDGGIFVFELADEFDE